MIIKMHYSGIPEVLIDEDPVACCKQQLAGAGGRVGWHCFVKGRNSMELNARNMEERRQGSSVSMELIKKKRGNSQKILRKMCEKLRMFHQDPCVGSIATLIKYF